MFDLLRATALSPAETTRLIATQHDFWGLTHRILTKEHGP